MTYISPEYPFYNITHTALKIRDTSLIFMHVKIIHLNITKNKPAPKDNVVVIKRPSCLTC